MSDLVKNVTMRMLIEINKRMGIQVGQNVEENANEEIRKSLKEIVYSILVKDDESNEKETEGET